MLKQKQIEIINTAAAEGRLSYKELNDDERLALVSSLLFHSDEGLINADSEHMIQHAIARVIFHNANSSSIQYLLDVIKRVFITGEKGKYCSYFEDQIETLLFDKWSEMNAKENEHYEHDLMQRIHDSRREDKLLHFIF